LQRTSILRAFRATLTKRDEHVFFFIYKPYRRYLIYNFISRIPSLFPVRVVLRYLFFISYIIVELYGSLKTIIDQFPTIFQSFRLPSRFSADIRRNSRPRAGIVWHGPRRNVRFYPPLSSWEVGDRIGADEANGPATSVTNGRGERRYVRSPQTPVAIIIVTTRLRRTVFAKENARTCGPTLPGREKPVPETTLVVCVCVHAAT